ncbi:MAG TPA: hypothetical protein VF183_05090 [Acidimicrobiales bacterium]
MSLVAQRQRAGTDLGDPVAPAARGGSWRTLRRLARAPLWAHAVLLAVLLTALVPLVLGDELSHADEGAALVQALQLAEGDGWVDEHPFPAADPEGRAYPIDLSMKKAGSLQYIPYARHPTYPLLLAPLVGALGGTGATLLSVAGTVGAAVGAALLARRLDPRLDRLVLWSTALATPLVYDSYVVIAHTIAAAAVAFAVLLLTGRPSIGRIVGGCALLSAAQLLRNEAILLGGAFALALVAVGVWRRARAGIGVAIAVLGTTGATYLLDARFASWVSGGEKTRPFVIEPGSSWIQDRLDAFSFTVLAPSDGSTTALLLGSLATVLVIAAAWVARRHPSDHSGITLFLTCALGMAALHWYVAPSETIPGLLFATPFAVAALVVARPSREPAPFTVVVLGAAALFFLAVCATQYGNGGGGGWGGRYFAIALPLVVPFAVRALRDAFTTIDAAGRRTVAAAAAALVVVIAAHAVSSIALSHRIMGSYRDVVDAAAAETPAGDGDDRPVVVSTRRGLGRFAYRETREQRWLEVPDGSLGEYVTRLRELGVDRFVLLTREPEQHLAEVGATYRLAEERHITTSVPFGRTATSNVVVLVMRAT